MATTDTTPTPRALPTRRSQPKQQKRRQPKQQRRRLPPTVGMLSESCYTLVDRLTGGRNFEDDAREELTASIYNFGLTSVTAAWNVVYAARLAVSAYHGVLKLRHGRWANDVAKEFEDLLKQVKKEDLEQKNALLKELKGKETEKARKQEIKSELKELLLQGLPTGTRMEISDEGLEMLVEGMREWFRPVEGSPLAEEDLPKQVRRNIRFFDFLAQQLFSDENGEAYLAARAAEETEDAEETEEEDSNAATDEIAAAS